MANILCLICLRTENEEHYSIFDADLRTPDMTILEKIRRCSEFKLIPEENDNIPNQICSRCLDDLTATWRFRKNVERSHKKYDILLKTNESNTLKDIQYMKLNQGKRIDCNAEEDNFVLLENDIESNEKQPFSVHIDDVIVEAVSEEDFEERLEIADYEEFEKEYSEDEIIEEHFQAGREKDLSDIDHHIIRADSNDDFDSRHEEMIKSIDVDETIETFEYPNLHRKRQSRQSEQTSQNVETESKKRKLNKRITSEEILNQEDEEVSNETKKCKRNKKISMPKICDICGNRYKYQHALNAHMRRHTNDRPYRCEFCEKSFVEGVEMQRHMRVHTGQKPYSCKHCDRKFSDFGSRVKHERTHTGERPYLCNTCGKSFAYAHVLTVHLRTHTGEKKFQCTLCEKGFTKKIYLQSHMVQHSRCDLLSNKTKYNTEEKSIKLKEFIVGKYVDEIEFEDATGFVKSESSPTIASEDNDYKYVISVQ